MLDLIVRQANLNGSLRDLGIQGETLVAIADHLNEAAHREVFADGRVVIPGFVDCHLHLDKCLLNEKSPYVDGTGPEKGALTLKRKVDFTVDDITARAETMIQRAIASGTLALRTNVDVDASVGLKGIQALVALREKYRSLITIQIAAFAQEGVFADGQTESLLEEALKAGADLLGGHTIAKGEGEKHIDFILNLAKKANVDADFHLDESGQRQHYLLPYVIQRMKALGLRGHVNGIHSCTLAALEPQELQEALALMAEQRLSVTVAPTAISTRALAPVKKLLEAGILVGLGSDNIRDFFNPLGSGDIKHAALLLSYVHRFFSADEQTAIWNMITVNGAALLKLPQYGLTLEGAPAHLTVLDALTPQTVIAYTAQPVLLVRSGNVILDRLER
jgi:cytosine/creatinine deaminase